MKNKIFFLIAVLLTCMSAVFAAYTDSFSSQSRDPLFLVLIDSIKNNRGVGAVEEAYEKYMAEEHSDVEKSRAEYHMVRYYVDIDEENMAQIHLEREKDFFNSITDASDLEKRTAEADLASAEYYLTGKLSKGMESNSLMKDLYEDYPDEYYIAVQEAFRLIYAPRIAGGSVKRAREILDKIAGDINGIAPLDYYSFLVASAMAFTKDKEYYASEAYLDAALAIYSFDVAVPDIRKDNAKGLH